MLDSGDHQITDVLGGDAAGGSNVPHGLAVTAVECKGDAHLFAIVASDLQGVRAPAGVAPIDGNATIMAPLLPAAVVALKQQPVHLHDPVDPLGIGRCAPDPGSLAAQKGVDPAITVGGQIGDQRPDVADQVGIR